MPTRFLCIYICYIYYTYAFISVWPKDILHDRISELKLVINVNNNNPLKKGGNTKTFYSLKYELSIVSLISGVIRTQNFKKTLNFIKISQN